MGEGAAAPRWLKSETCLASHVLRSHFLENVFPFSLKSPSFATSMLEWSQNNMVYGLELERRNKHLLTAFSVAALSSCFILLVLCEIDSN